MQYLIVLLILPISLFPTETLSGGQALPSPLPSSDVPSSIPTLKTEVVGFSLEGKRVWERLNIDDMDAAVTPSGQRLLPLLRLLKALQMKVKESDEIISFSPAPGVTIILDLQRKEVQTKGQTRSISFVVGVSDITYEKDIYFPPEVLAEMLYMRIEWSDRDYQFFAKTDQRLSMWKTSQGGSALAIRTQEIPTNLPEPLPPAKPGNFSLDFLELQFRPYFTENTYQGGSSRYLTIDPPRQIFWGNSFGGQYRLDISEQQVSYGPSGFERTHTAALMLNHIDWTYSFLDAEIFAGDSIFGLNDLTFPVIKMTGFRFNGVIGFPQEDKDWRTSPGLSYHGIPSRVFEGTAPVGSKAELFLNGRSIETQMVSVGSYRFEDIRLTPGALNVVRIVVTEPTGYQRVIEESIFGRSIHLPRGAFAYLGGVGTNRETVEWSTRGLWGGGRVLYGLTDSLTLGTTWAVQENFYKPVIFYAPVVNLLTSSQGIPPRQYPQSSYHAGGQADWLPFEYFSLSGDISVSKGDIGSYEPSAPTPGVSLRNGNSGQDSYDGLGYWINAYLYPSPSSQVGSQFFHYGLNFFNGENVLLRDKEGYWLNGRWAINPQWGASALIGSAWNLEKTLNVNFQNLEISSRIIPKMTIAPGVMRVSPNWENGGPKTLYTLKVQASPAKSIYFDGFFSAGEYLDPASQLTMDFFNGLRIPGFSEFRAPTVAANLQLQVTAGNSGGLAYWKDSNRNRPSIYHHFNLPEKPIRMHTAVGYDFAYEKPYFNHRTDYLFDRLGQKAIGIDALYDSGQVTFSLLFTFRELFSNHRGVMTRVPDSNSSPDRAGVHGRVFIDSNGNGIMDPGEAGVENVQVILDNVNKTLTGRNGYFLIPAFGESKKCRVFLNIETVPAIYSPTSGIQTAYLKPRGLTEVNLGIAPLNSITGLVHTISPDKGVQPLYGIRVYVTSMIDDKVIVDSITAQDGSYYLGDLRPGRYYLQVDGQTLPPKQTIPDRRMIEVAPQKEPQELKIALLIGAEEREGGGGGKSPVPPELKKAPPVKAAKAAPQGPSTVPVPQGAKTFERSTGEREQFASFGPSSSAIVSEEEVRQFFERYRDRYNRKDLEGFLSFFSAKAVQNQKYDHERIRKIYANFFDRNKELRYQIAMSKIDPQLNGVEVKAEYELEGVLKKGGEKKIWKGQIRWFLVRENGELKIVSLDYQPQKSSK